MTFVYIWWQISTNKNCHEFDLNRAKYTIVFMVVWVEIIFFPWRFLDNSMQLGPITSCSGMVIRISAAEFVCIWSCCNWHPQNQSAKIRNELIYQLFYFLFLWRTILSTWWCKSLHALDSYCSITMIKLWKLTLGWGFFFPTYRNFTMGPQNDYCCWLQMVE